MIGGAAVRPHIPTPWARMDGTALVYPPAAVDSQQ